MHYPPPKIIHPPSPQKEKKGEDQELLDNVIKIYLFFPLPNFLCFIPFLQTGRSSQRKSKREQSKAMKEFVPRNISQLFSETGDNFMQIFQNEDLDGVPLFLRRHKNTRSKISSIFNCSVKRTWRT